MQNLLLKHGLGYKTRFCYDNWGNLVEVHQADGSKSEFEYDEYGNCKKVTNPLGAEQLMDYDALGRITRIQMPDGNIISMKYNGHNEVIMVKDKQRIVNFEYTWFGKLKKRKELDRIKEFIYDEEEQLKSIVNEKKETYKFEYDGKGNVIEEVGFDGLRYGYIYNKAGWLERVNQPGGKEKSFKYDKDGNIIQVQYADGSIERFKYNQMGSMLEAINNDSSIVFELDIMERVKKVIQDGHVIESEYDKLGQRILLKSSLGAYIEQEYNHKGEINQIKASTIDGKTWVSKLNYNSLGQETSRTMPGGGYSEWEYDKTGRPIIQVIKGADDRNNIRSYMWDINYQLKSITCNSNITKYNYDEFGNLAWSNSNTETIFRSMDEVGNIYKTKDHLDREYGEGGRLLRSDKAIYEYDEQGNLCKKKIGNKIWEFKYNGKGLMSKVTCPTRQEVVFKYDALGRRIQKSYNGKTMIYLWDGDVILHEWKENNKIPEESVTWVFNRDYTPIAKIFNKKVYSIINDHLGTPIEIKDEEGYTVWSSETDIYGKVIKQNYENVTCQFRFPGQYEDEETGLYYNRFRYYSPEDGVYTNQDPMGINGSLNLYGYVKNTLISIDFFGLFEIKILTEGIVYRGGNSGYNNLSPRAVDVLKTDPKKGLSTFYDPNKAIGDGSKAQKIDISKLGKNLVAEHNDSNGHVSIKPANDPTNELLEEWGKMRGKPNKYSDDVKNAIVAEVKKCEIIG